MPSHTSSAITPIHFGGPPQRDPFSSGAYDLPRRERVLSHPVSWLVGHGWRRARRVPPWLAKFSTPSGPASRDGEALHYLDG
jgi:hypothetical protein